MSGIGSFGEREKRLRPDQNSDVNESEASIGFEGEKKRLKVQESFSIIDEVAEEVFSEDGKRLRSQESEGEHQSLLKKAKPAKGKGKANEVTKEVAQDVLKVKSKRSARGKSVGKAAEKVLKRERTEEDDENERTLKGTKLSSGESGKTGALAQKTLEAEKSPLDKAAKHVADKELRAELLQLAAEVPEEQKVDFVTSMASQLEGMPEKEGKLALLQCVREIAHNINSASLKQRKSIFDAIKRAVPLFRFGEFDHNIGVNEFVMVVSTIPVGQRNEVQLSWAKLLLKHVNRETAESILSQIVRMSEEGQKNILQRVKDMQNVLPGAVQSLIFELLRGMPVEAIEKLISEIERLLQGDDNNLRKELLDAVIGVEPSERLKLLNQVLSLANQSNKLSIIKFLTDNSAQQIQDIKESTESYLRGVPATLQEKAKVYVTLAKIGVSKNLIFGTSVNRDATDQRRAVIAMAEKLLDGSEGYADKISILEAVVAITPDQRADVLLQAGPWLKGSSGKEKADIILSIAKLEPDQRAATLAAAAAWEPKEGINKSELIRGSQYINLAQMEDIKLQARPFYEDVESNSEKFKIFQIIAKTIRQENRAALLSYVLPLLKESSGSDRIELLPEFRNIWPEDLEEIAKKAAPFLEDANPRCKGHIFLAVAAIPDDERDAVLTDVRPWIQGITDIERAKAIQLLADVPAHRRAVLLARVSRLAQGVESPQARLELLKNNAERMRFPEGYDSVYKMDVARENLRNDPLQLLWTISEMMNKESAYELRIHFMNEPGIDAGGLGKEFISELFEGIKTKMRFKEYSNGLYRPILPMKNYEYQPLSYEEKQHYYQLGQLMMFCLNAEREYPIGMLFDQAVFTMLTKLQPKHFEKSFDELIATQEGFTELFAIYEAMNSDNEDDMRSLNIMKSYLASEETREQTIETIQSIMKPIMVPIIEIAKGMKAAPFAAIMWDDIQAMRPSLLSELLQGKVTREMIIEKLEFDESIPEDKQQWMKEWINQADFAKVQRFLFALTGARALGNKGLTIEPSSENVHFHTCTNTVELPLAAISSQQEFNEFMALALTGTEKYSKG